MPGQLNFEFRFADQSLRASSAQTLRILLLGNFRGTRHAEQPLATRPIYNIDIDNYDDVLAKIAPRISLTEPACDIDFSEYDDFHPDNLYRQLPPFAEMRALRKRLRDPAQAAQAIAEISSSAETNQVTKPPTSDFAQLLGAQPAQPKLKPEQHLVDHFISRIISEHIVNAPDTSAYLNSLDYAQSELMRTILHHPAVQQLEANWRGVWWLVSELNTDEDLSLHILDLTEEELSADLSAAGTDLSQSILARKLTQRTGADAQSWDLIVGLYRWPAQHEQLNQLAALTAIAQAAGGVLLSAAMPDFVGARDFAAEPHSSDWQTLDPEFQQHWQQFRQSALAPHLGLALPRVLLRLPYGAHSDEIESFEFTEQMPIPEQERFLWGNPAIACALAIGRYLLESGATDRLIGQLDIDDCPAYSYILEGETQLQACAEAYLGEQAALAINQQGLIPLLSFRHRNAVRVGGLSSCAEPPVSLLSALCA